MTQRDTTAALLISVWTQDGDRLGRLRGFRNRDEQSEELGAAVGDEAILEAVRAWLRSLDTPDG